jgi:TetR/AcrR family transcriptional regulator, transcriptional repressor for nem operon
VSIARVFGNLALVEGYLSAWHRDHPEAGCGVAGIATDVARAGGPARPGASCTRQVGECLAVLADLIDDLDRQAGEREAVLILSVLVGAISIPLAVDEPDLSQQSLASSLPWPP